MEKQIELTRKITQDNFVTEKIDVIKNNLLGSYDNDGDYIIPSKIIDELIALKKIKKTSFGNSIFCVGNLLGYGEIAFELLFDSKTDNQGKAQATLFVLEAVDKINGYLQNTLKTKIGEYSDTLDNYINQAYSNFNIITEDEDDSDDEGKELLDDLYSEDSFILAKKQFTLALDKLLDEKILDAYGKYFTYRISALTKLNNEFSKAIMDTFNNQYSLIENVFMKEKNYKTLNELLDKCIEEVSGTNEKFIEQEKDFIEKTTPALDSFVDNFNKINHKSENKALNMLDKSDREKMQEIIMNDKEVESEKSESIASVDQIINNVTSRSAEPEKQKSQVEKTEQQVEQQSPAKQSEPSVAQQVIMEHIQDNKVNSEITKENDSFYKAFTASRNSEKETSKIVDMSYSTHIDDSYKDEESRAYNSLKDRMSRLEKFKESSAVKESVVAESVSHKNDNVQDPINNYSTQRRGRINDGAVSSLFDRLKKEQQSKSNQLEARSFEEREM